MADVFTRIEGPGAGVTGPIYSLLFPIPVVCFAGALITDLVYASSAFLMWLHFSQWLIAAGIAFGIIAGIVLLIELSTSRAIRGAPGGWAHVALFYVGLVAGVFNSLVHTADGWTAVVPTGLVLSAVGAILMLAAGAMLRRVRLWSFKFRRL